MPNPEISPVPDLENIEIESDSYLNHLLEKWSLPLSEIEEEKFHSPTFKSRWGVEYCINAMFDHALMHSIRNEFQLRKLILKQSNK